MGMDTNGLDGRKAHAGDIRLHLSGGTGHQAVEDATGTFG